MKSFKTILFLTAFAAVYFTGCATTGGSLFKDTTSGSASLINTPAKSSSDNKTSSQEKTSEAAVAASGQNSNPSLTITSSPSSCNVFLNNTYVGETPLTLNNLESGKYKILLKKYGYYSETRWINYNSEEKTSLHFELQLVTGYLFLETLQPGTSVRANGTVIKEGVNELPVGNYRISASLFGFEPLETSVNVYKNTTTRLKIYLKPAKFKISELALSRQKFNPDNPGGLSLCRISFSVTTYGSGSLEIKSPSGEQVLTHKFPLFSGWDQQYTWKGTDGYGKPLEDGVYKITIKGKSRDRSESDTKTAFVEIDRSMVIRDRNTFSGVSGTMFAPTPDVLPPGSFQASIAGVGHFEAEGYRFPVVLSSRIPIGGKTEIDIMAGTVIQSPEPNGYVFSASGKGILSHKNDSPFSLSGTVKGTYLYNIYRDSMDNYTGLSIGLPAGITLGPLTMVLSPDITLSPYRVSLTNIQSPPGFYIWGYGRAALIFDFGPVWGAFSGSVRTEPFTEGFSIDYPVAAAGELHWILPDTGIIISGFVSGEFDPEKGYYINAGGGLGLIN